MTSEQRTSLVARNTVEVVTAEELTALLDREEHPKAYIGFEPSGLMHIALGFITAAKIQDLVEAGFATTVLLADWHAKINDKFGGDLEKIRACGRYFEDAFHALGVPESARFVTASELTAEPGYWEDVIRVSKNCTMARMKRAMTIMGRKEEDAEQDAAKMIYPAMQVTDVHRLDLDLAYGGMDQRHAHMLYRDVQAKLGWKKVVAVHTPLLSGLKGGGRMDSPDAKMSKSDPNNAIFLHDTAASLPKKLEKAFCPAKQVEGNPVLEYARHLLLPRGPLKVERPSKFGGDVTFREWRDLEKAWTDGALHPADLKRAVGYGISQLLVPVHRYFSGRSEAFDRVRDLTGLTFA